MLMSEDEMIFVSLTSTLGYIMPDTNAQPGLFLFTTTVDVSKRDVLSHRLLGDSPGTVFRVLGSSQTT
jgi:hypothetical protein